MPPVSLAGTHAELDALFHMEINILEPRVILDAYNYPYRWSAIEFYPQSSKIYPTSEKPLYFTSFCIIRSLDPVDDL